MYFKKYNISSGKPVFVFLKFELDGNVFFINVPSTDQYRLNPRPNAIERYM